MFCPKCGNQIPDNANACPNCGHVFSQSGQTANTIPPQESMQVVPEKKDRTGCIIGCVVAAVVGIVVVGVLAAIFVPAIMGYVRKAQEAQERADGSPYSAYSEIISADYSDLSDC